MKKWGSPARCDFDVEDFSRILVAPGGCDPLSARDLPFSPSASSIRRSIGVSLASCPQCQRTRGKRSAGRGPTSWVPFLRTTYGTQKHRGAGREWLPCDHDTLISNPTQRSSITRRYRRRPPSESGKRYSASFIRESWQPAANWASARRLRVGSYSIPWSPEFSAKSR